MYWQTEGYVDIPTNTGVNLYFYVGDIDQNHGIVNMGRIGEQVANCITRNDCKAYITETYQNGSSWYRVYSDGWCEQGGIVSAATGGTKVTFLKPFKDTNYVVVSSQMFRGYTNDQWNGNNEIGSIA